MAIRKAGAEPLEDEEGAAAREAERRQSFRARPAARHLKIAQPHLARDELAANRTMYMTLP